MVLVSPSLPVRVFSKGIKRVAHILCYTALIGSLAGCTLDVFDYKKKSPTSASSSALTFPDKNALIVPPAPAGNTNPNSPDFNPALGLSTDRLFAEPIRDTNDRFIRLENAVQKMRDELDSVSPAINRLVAVESDIQNLIEQLEILLEGEPMLPPDPFADFKGFDMVSPVTEDPNFKDTRPEALEPVMKAEGMMADNLKKTFSSPSVSDSAGASGAPDPVSVVAETPVPDTAPTIDIPNPSLPVPAPLQDISDDTQDQVDQVDREIFIAPPTEQSVTRALANVSAMAPKTFNPEMKTVTDDNASAPPQGNAGTLKLVRMGDNGGKVRIVIESAVPIKPVINLDNDENILLIDVPDGKATLGSDDIKTTSRHIDTAVINPRDNGYTLVFGLNKEGLLSDQNLLPPGSVSPHYRYYIDFTPQ